MLYLIFNLTPFILISLLVVGFFTLFERLLLAIIQFSFGPDWLLFGCLQPIFDGINLLTSNIWFSFYFIDLFILSLNWGSLVFSFSSIQLLFYDILCSLMCSECSLVLFIWILFNASFCLFIIMFCSMCKFSFMSLLSFTFQVVSFDLCASVFLVSLILVVNSSSVILWSLYSFSVVLILALNFTIWLICLIDSCSIPFDFLEAESELVSGYCTEFGSLLFVVSFLCEYLDVIVVGVLFNEIVPMNCWLFDLHILYLLLTGFILLLCSCFTPRFRFDYLNSLLWTSLIWIFYDWFICLCWFDSL